MSAPNSKQSDARNTHIPSLEFEMPVAVSLWVCSCTAVLEWTAVSATDGHLLVRRGRIQGGGVPVRVRSEEHTSELQSLMRSSYAVFCLKKKKQTHNHIPYLI